MSADSTETLEEVPTPTAACLGGPVPAPFRLSRRTVRTCPLRRAAAVVGVDPVHTNPSVPTPVVGAVVNILLTGAAFEPW